MMDKRSVHLSELRGWVVAAVFFAGIFLAGGAGYMVILNALLFGVKSTALVWLSSAFALSSIMALYVSARCAGKVVACLASMEAD